MVFHWNHLSPFGPNNVRNPIYSCPIYPTSQIDDILWNVSYFQDIFISITPRFVLWVYYWSIPISAPFSSSASSFLGFVYSVAFRQGTSEVHRMYLFREDLSWLCVRTVSVHHAVMLECFTSCFCFCSARGGDILFLHLPVLGTKHLCKQWEDVDS